MRVFSFFLAIRRLDPRNEALLEAVVKEARTTKHQWLTACDANMSPKDFEESVWFQRAGVHRGANGSFKVQIKKPKGELIEITYEKVMQVEASGERSRKWELWKTSTLDHTRKFPLF